MNNLRLSALLLSLAACGKQAGVAATATATNQSSLTFGVAGLAPAGTTDVYAVSATGAGSSIRAKLSAGNQFRLDLLRGNTYVINFATNGKVRSTLTFTANAGGAKTHLLPAPAASTLTGQALESDLDLGQVTENAQSEAEPQHNPLDIIDSDDDGVANKDDDDDDGDDLKDDEDDDCEGDGKADKSQSFDSDSDGKVDAIDSDDDNDGIEDSQDASNDAEDAGSVASADDHDGDGIADEDDADDDNDGVDDSEDDQDAMADDASKSGSGH